MTTKYKLTCHGPVHVGTGTSFTRLDSVYNSETRMWMPVDLDKVNTDPHQLAREMEKPDFAWILWLRQNHVKPDEVALYQLSCSQDPENTEVREAIKDPYLNPFIPGSTIKGAIRTALLWHLVDQNRDYLKFTEMYLVLCAWSKQIYDFLKKGRRFGDVNGIDDALRYVLHIDGEEVILYRRVLLEAVGVRQDQVSESAGRIERGLRDLSQKKEWLALPIERKVFGKNPNHDLLRTIQVSDTQAVGLGSMRVYLTWTYTIQGDRLVEKIKDGVEFKVFAECFKRQTELELSLRIDDFLFGASADKELRFRGAKETTVRELADACNRFAEGLISAEQEFYTQYKLDVLTSFYDYLKEVRDRLKPGAFLLNIGWGGGWEPKTIGPHEFMSSADFYQLRVQYSLGKIGFPIFPKTRRVVYVKGAPQFPLGWVSLEPIER